MSQINYMLALVCLTLLSAGAIGGAIYVSQQPDHSLVTTLATLAGMGFGAIAGVVKQPRETPEAK